VALIRASGGDWVVASLDGVEAAPDSMVFSPGGSAAAFITQPAVCRFSPPACRPPLLAISTCLVCRLRSRLWRWMIPQLLADGCGQAESVSLYRIPVTQRHPARLVPQRIFVAFQRRHAGASPILSPRPSTRLRPGRRGGNPVVAFEYGILDWLPTPMRRPTRIRAVAPDRVHLRSQRGPAITLDCACTPTGLFRLRALHIPPDRTCRRPAPVLDANAAPRIVAVPPPVQALHFRGPPMRRLTLLAVACCCGLRYGQL